MTLHAATVRGRPDRLPDPLVPDPWRETPQSSAPDPLE